MVTIITPMHNDGRFVRQAIESVLAQTYQDWEMIIVDDCSTDDSLSIANSYASERIRVIRNAENKGAAYSRNVALREAKGDYIAFLDADDWWAPNKLERQLKFMQDLGIQFSCTAYFRVQETGEKTLASAPYVISKKRMRRCSYVGCLTAMYDRRAIGLIQVKESITKRNDYAMWLQISERFPCYFLAEPLAYYRIRANSLSRISNRRLLKYHQKLFRIQMGYSWIRAWFCALRNGYYVLKKKDDYLYPEDTQLSKVFF